MCVAYRQNWEGFKGIAESDYNTVNITNDRQPFNRNLLIYSFMQANTVQFQKKEREKKSQKQERKVENAKKYENYKS